MNPFRFLCNVMAYLLAISYFMKLAMASTHASPVARVPWYTNASHVSTHCAFASTKEFMTLTLVAVPHPSSSVSALATESIVVQNAGLLASVSHSSAYTKSSSVPATFASASSTRGIVSSVGPPVSSTPKHLDVTILAVLPSPAVPTPPSALGAENALWKFF